MRDVKNLSAEVLSNTDIVLLILRGNVGPSTFCAASEVCHAWHAVCRSDVELLRSTALYQGGLTKTALCGLFVLTSTEAAALPHKEHWLKWTRKKCYIFSKPAVEQLLASDGFVRWHHRLSRRMHGMRAIYKYSLDRKNQFRLEETLHAGEKRRAHWK